MKRALWVCAALLAAAAIVVPFLDADFARPKIERALERGLGRRVEVGKAYFSLLAGPGFTLEDVTIHEDPRAGIEPFAHVLTLEARVRLLSLLSRRLEFSSLTLGSDTSINLVKTAAGPWNFQLLLGGAQALAGAMPSIKMRGGRVNFKFGDTKSVFYFDDADFDVSRSGGRSVELRFSGAPSRTDRIGQNFGHFFVRGTWDPQRLDFNVELEPSSVEEVARLLDQRGFGLHGLLELEAQVSGPPSHLAITGQLQLNDVYRGDSLPKSAGAWGIDYKGTLDLTGEKLELTSASSAAAPPFALAFRAWDFLSQPHWEASAELNQVPLAAVAGVARQMGAAVSEKLTAAGSVSGGVQYNENGLSGRVELQDATISAPGAQTLRAADAAVEIDGKTVSLESSTVSVGDDESAEVEGSYDVGSGVDFRIATHGLSIADLRSFGLTPVPLLEQTSQGTWRGWVRYQTTAAGTGQWSGDYELENARVALDGFADPLRIQSAVVASNGRRVSVTKLRAKLGGIAFSGEYRWDPAAVRPHKFKIAIPAAKATEIEHIFAPALVRERGFFARTLRLGPAPVPDWLKARRADGQVSIGSLTAGDSEIRVDGARLLWDGAEVRLARVNAHIGESAATGEATVDLSGRAPRYHLQGKVSGVEYKGGTLDFEGSLDARGTSLGGSAGLLASVHGEGRMRGSSIEFAPDAEFGRVAGCFDLLASPGGPKWTIPTIEVVQDGETYMGSGSMQADGRLVLDLASRGRQVRYTSALASGGSTLLGPPMNTNQR